MVDTGNRAVEETVMATLTQLVSLLQAGGPGSGCRGPKCGRPITSKGFRQMKKKLQRIGFRIKKGTSAWDIVKTYDAWQRSGKAREKLAKETKRATERARHRIRRAIEKGRLPKIPKQAPGLTRKGGKEFIDVQDPWKGRVKKQYTSGEGYQITELKTPKQYEKRGTTWINKPSLYKGQFLVDVAEHKTYNDPKERNHFFIHQETPEKGVSVEVHRNFGRLGVNVIERKLGQYGAIENHREVSFKNIGRAMGFLNKRYGITFKLK